MNYKGNCHCGRHRFEVDIPDLSAVERCECGLCAKTGALWLVSPEPIRVTRGFDDTLTIYRTDDVVYKFCSTCGTGMQIIRQQSHKGTHAAINIRTLLDVNPFQLEAARPSSSIFSSTNPISHDIKQYSGRCHCGDITVTVTTPPLPEIEVKEDNCSICVRNAFIGIYPPSPAVQITGQDRTRDYTFNRGFNGHPFCKTCGVHIFMILHGPPARVVESLPVEKQEMVRRKLAIRPVNVRVLEGVEWDRLSIQREDEGTEGYSLSE